MILMGLSINVIDINFILLHAVTTIVMVRILLRNRNIAIYMNLIAVVFIFLRRLILIFFLFCLLHIVVFIFLEILPDAVSFKCGHTCWCPKWNFILIVHIVVFNHFFLFHFCFLKFIKSWEIVYLVIFRFVYFSHYEETLSVKGFRSFLSLEASDLWKSQIVKGDLLRRLKLQYTI